MDTGVAKSRIRQTVAGWDELLKGSTDPLTHPLAGHCYCASEALYHLTGGKDRWQVERVSVSIPTPENPESSSVTHWYLRERSTDTIVDLTKEQFTEYPHADIQIPYEESTPTGFLTKEPSKRTQRLLDRI